MTRDMKWRPCAGLLLLFIALAGLLLYAIRMEPAPPDTTAYFFQRGIAETGALNFVTGIYLGYRGFDTLGETIVLMLAVSGVMFLIGKRS